jgi:hypothetical protein
MFTGQVFSSTWEQRLVGHCDACLVEVLIFERCDSLIPVPEIVDLPLRQQALNKPGGTRVVQDLREILATNEINMVDPKVRRNDLVAGLASASSPLDNPRASAIQ